MDNTNSEETLSDNASTEELKKDKVEEKNSEKVLNKDYATPEKQEARAFLRERFLRLVTGIIGKFFNFSTFSILLWLGKI